MKKRLIIEIEFDDEEDEAYWNDVVINDYKKIVNDYNRLDIPTTIRVEDIIEYEEPKSLGVTQLIDTICSERFTRENLKDAYDRPIKESFCDLPKGHYGEHKSAWETI